MTTLLTEVPPHHRDDPRTALDALLSTTPPERWAAVLLDRDDPFADERRRDLAEWLLLTGHDPRRVDADLRVDLSGDRDLGDGSLVPLGRLPVDDLLGETARVAELLLRIEHHDALGLRTSTGDLVVPGRSRRDVLRAAARAHRSGLVSLDPPTFGWRITPLGYDWWNE